MTQDTSWLPCTGTRQSRRLPVLKSHAPSLELLIAQAIHAFPGERSQPDLSGLFQDDPREMCFGSVVELNPSTTLNASLAELLHTNRDVDVVQRMKKLNHFVRGPYHVCNATREMPTDVSSTTLKELPPQIGSRVERLRHYTGHVLRNQGRGPSPCV